VCIAFESTSHSRIESPAFWIRGSWASRRRRAYDDVLVGPRRVFGGVAGAVAVVSRVRPLAGDPPVSIGGYFAKRTHTAGSSRRTSGVRHRAQGVRITWRSLDHRASWPARANRGGANPRRQGGVEQPRRRRGAATGPRCSMPSRR
jgi:hypothetical protein